MSLSNFHFAETSWPWMQAVLDAASEGILIEHRELVVYANDAYAKLLRYRRSTDVIKRPVATLIARSDADRLIRFGRMRVAGESPPSTYDFDALCTDCSSVRLQASVSMAMYAGKPYIMTIVRPFPAEQAKNGRLIAGPHETLSERERTVMDMILGGKRPKEIAWELTVSEKTVATHRKRLLGKLGAADSRELFQYALRHGLIDWS